jgi:tyrosinase
MAAGPFTRKDVGGLTAGSPDLLAYAKAIKAMKALPNNNPLSWTYQAAIHGTTLPGGLPAWNTCQHGTPYFWSWHRMYLYWFERIIRKMSGDPNFALPYWNYQSASERQLPAPFRNSSSPLYTPNRGAGWNSGAASLAPSAVATTGFVPLIPYFDAQSNCEGTPHAAVHVSIGGWMGSVPTAAQDPIFYLHHANIDRWWNLWLKQGGGRTDPLSDTAWKTTKFLFFDENGAQKWMTGCDVLRAAEQLNYSYENEGTQVKQYCGKLVLPWWIFEIALVKELPPLRLPPQPDPPPFRVDLKELRQRMLRIADDEESELTLELESVVADKQPEHFWEVYLGLPKGARPDPQSAHYIGNVALFGHSVRGGDHQHGGGPAKFSFRIERAAKAALTRDQSGALDLQFVPRGAVIRGENERARPLATLEIGKARIATRRLKKT